MVGSDREKNREKVEIMEQAVEGRGSILKRMAWEGVTDETWRVLEGERGKPI